MALLSKEISNIQRTFMLKAQAYTRMLKIKEVRIYLYIFDWIDKDYPD